MINRFLSGVPKAGIKHPTAIMSETFESRQMPLAFERAPQIIFRL
jgi:hypothetical protein